MYITFHMQIERVKIKVRKSIFLFLFVKIISCYSDKCSMASKLLMLLIYEKGPTSTSHLLREM